MGWIWPGQSELIRFISNTPPRRYCWLYVHASENLPAGKPSGHPSDCNIFPPGCSKWNYSIARLRSNHIQWRNRTNARNRYHRSPRYINDDKRFNKGRKLISYFFLVFLGVFSGWTASDFTSTVADAAKFAYYVYGPNSELLTEESQQVCHFKSLTLLLSSVPQQ